MQWTRSYVAGYLRTLLILGRASNLPTVWSNCLAGWWISGASFEHGERFFLLLLGATFLYFGGMFLNDAFDVAYDLQHRPERPIPSRKISASSVWQWGFGWLFLGLLCFGLLGRGPFLWASLLTMSILIYDALHKRIAFAPVLMAMCRFLLILLAAASSPFAIRGYAVWTALVLGSYIVGLSFIARKESQPSPLAYWPCLPLVAPLGLALVVNRSMLPGPGVVFGFQMAGLLLSGLLLGWILLCLRHLYWTHHPVPGRAVASLLAGIPLVDLLAVGWTSWGATLVFLMLVLLAKLFQRFIPAT